MSKLNHIAFIMDGNNRWSHDNSVSLFDSYNNGANVAKKLLYHLLSKYDVSYITFYTLSLDNFLKRDKLFLNIITDVLNHIDYSDYTYVMFGKKVSYFFLGDKRVLDNLGNDKIKDFFKNQSNNFNVKVNLAFGYSSRMEVSDSLRRILIDYKSGKFEVDDISYNKVKNYFYSSDPDPDFIIRTGGMKRLSDFLLLQSAYAELYFSDKLWSDFDILDLDKAIDIFDNTKRNYGR